MGIISNAIAWAVATAQDDSHGYSQVNRWGPDYDCSSFVITAFQNAGLDVMGAGATYTENMRAAFIACGFKDVTAQINLSTGSGLKAGDVLLNTINHTELMYTPTQVVGARGADGYTQTGDQTGNEIRIRAYYNYPWNYVLRYEETGNDITKEDVVSGNYYLSQSEMEKNAAYIWSRLKMDGWSMQAVAALLSNMQTESTINPGIWESLNSGNLSGGFGLVQWTPATKLIEWANSNGVDYTDIDVQLERILYEMQTGIQYYTTPSYPETFREFSTSTADPGYLAYAFMYNYERPADLNQPWRKTNAASWYEYLSSIDSGGTGNLPSDPDPEPVPRKGLPLWLLYAVTRRM